MMPNWISNDETIYVVAHVVNNTSNSSNYLYAIIDNKTQPNEKWKLAIDNKTSVSCVFDASGVVYVGTDSGTIYAIQDFLLYGNTLIVLYFLCLTGSGIKASGIGAAIAFENAVKLPPAVAGLSKLLPMCAAGLLLRLLLKPEVQCRQCARASGNNVQDRFSNHLST